MEYGFIFYLVFGILYRTLFTRKPLYILDCNHPSHAKAIEIAYREQEPNF
jgi:hypothetical protein